MTAPYSKIFRPVTTMGTIRAMVNDVSWERMVLRSTLQADQQLCMATDYLLDAIGKCIAEGATAEDAVVHERVWSLRPQLAPLAAVYGFEIVDHEEFRNKGRLVIINPEPTP